MDKDLCSHCTEPAELFTDESSGEDLCENCFGWVQYWREEQSQRGDPLRLHLVGERGPE